MRLKILVTVFVLFALGYSFFWYYIAGEVEKRIELQIEPRMAGSSSSGLSIRYQDLDIGGFPTRLEVTLRNLTITTSDRKRVISFPAITMIAFPWDIDHIVIVTRAGAARIGDIAMTVGKSRASVVVDPVRHQFRRISVILQALNWTSGQSSQRDETSSAQHIRLHLLRPVDKAGQSGVGMEQPLLMKLYFEADGVTIAGQGGAKQGGVRMAAIVFNNKIDRARIDRARIDLELRGNKMPAYSANALAHWRDRGGTVVIKNLALAAGKISISVKGEAALDHDMKPLGAFSAKIDGIRNIVDNLAGQAAVLRPTGKMMLQQLRKLSRSGTRSGGNAGKAVNIAISLQGGLVFFGPIPVYELSPIVK